MSWECSVNRQAAQRKWKELWKIWKKGVAHCHWIIVLFKSIFRKLWEWKICWRKCSPKACQAYRQNHFVLLNVSSRKFSYTRGNERVSLCHRRKDSITLQSKNIGKIEMPMWNHLDCQQKQLTKHEHSLIKTTHFASSGEVQISTDQTHLWQVHFFLSIRGLHKRLGRIILSKHNQTL